MGRIILFLLVIIAVAAGAYFIFNKKKERPPMPKQQPLAVGENTSTFNQSFENLLNAYYSVKEALVASDAARAGRASDSLLVAADSLRVGEINGDSTGVIKQTATDLAGTIAGSAKGLKGEQDLEAKRREFQMITEAMWSLTRTVKYSGHKIYYLFCPMAFNNQGAYWMSRDPEVHNPYFGNKMPDCGNLEDSLDYSKK